MHEDNSNIPFSFPHLSHQVVQLIRAAIPGSSSSSSSGNGSGGSVSRGKAVGSHLALILSLSCCPPLCVFVINSPTPRPFSALSAGVGISFVRRTGGVADADSKFVVKRLVQGSDTAIQGDVEVNDVVVRVSARALQFTAHVDVAALLQVDGHPVKGWDEKALLAHVMGEEGAQRKLQPKLDCTG